MPDPGLSATDIETVLAADPSTKGPDETTMVKKVASGQPLTTAERGHLETRLVESEVQQTEVEVVREAGNSRKRGNGRARAKDLAIRERRRLVMKKRLVWPPTPIKQIAKELGVSENTVMSDLEDIRNEHVEIFSGRRSAELAGTLIEQYDAIANEALRCAAGITNPTSKSRMMTAATRALA